MPNSKPYEPIIVTLYGIYNIYYHLDRPQPLPAQGTAYNKL